MSPRIQGSLQSQTLNVIRASGQISLKGIQCALGRSEPGSSQRIKHAVLNLVKGGHVERMAPAIYAYTGRRGDLGYKNAQHRMARVIRIRTVRGEVFSARKLAELADCSWGWSQRYIHFLLGKGILEKRGYEVVGPTKTRAAVYLALTEKLNTEWPILKRTGRIEELDNIVCEIRSKAFEISRACFAEKRSLAATKDLVSALSRLVEDGLRISQG